MILGEETECHFVPDSSCDDVWGERQSILTNGNRVGCSMCQEREGDNRESTCELHLLGVY